LDGTSLKLDDSFGLAVKAGVDVDINKDWFFNASLWRMDIDTEAESSLLGKFDVAIDPWALFVGVGTRF
jgi:outer membrane protein